MFFLNTV